MTLKLMTVLFAATTALCCFAQADNALTTDQLIKAVQNSVKDYAGLEPDMAKSISALRTTTVGSNAQVTIVMAADGMNMSAKYVCAPKGGDMACNLQQ